MANNSTDSRNVQYPPARGGDLPPGYDVADDEISLFDLWLVLVRRRWLMAAIFAVVATSGLAYALSRPTVYEYSATLSIGEVFKSGGEDGEVVLAPVQPPEGVVAEIRSVREPAAVREVVGDPAEAGFVPNVDVSSPEDSNLVILSGEATTGNADHLNRAIEIIAKRTEQSHAKRIESAREAIRRDVQAAQNELKRLSARKGSLNAELTDLDKRIKSLKQRRDELDQELKELLDQRHSADSGVSSRYLITLNSQIASVRSDLQRVDDHLNNKVPAERREARLALSEIRAAVDTQEEAKANAKSRLSDITNTRLNSAPQRSMEPTGTSAKLIAALVIVLGAMLAVFAAFVWEFITRANAYAKQHDGCV